jgi:hypothetical protein
VEVGRYLLEFLGPRGSCSEVVGADLQQLAVDVIDYMRKALVACDESALLVLDGWTSNRSPWPWEDRPAKRVHVGGAAGERDPRHRGRQVDEAR